MEKGKQPPKRKRAKISAVFVCIIIAFVIGLIAISMWYGHGAKNEAKNGQYTFRITQYKETTYWTDLDKFKVDLRTNIYSKVDGNERLYYSFWRKKIQLYDLDSIMIVERDKAEKRIITIDKYYNEDKQKHNL